MLGTILSHKFEILSAAYAVSTLVGVLAPETWLGHVCASFSADLRKLLGGAK